ncbi:Ion channel [Teladorsagia circumcincta]|uniref:Ion channel n=1 Tax=Teladorsagia circumcincta TaxID=45464 RepID=A0A2G9TRA2_TELCI|nr:Ion channel [Teladorsagia circumcincta]
MGYLEPHEDSMISLPIKFCLLLLAAYLLLCAVFIYFFDEWMGYLPHSGLSFFNTFYFSYISISTIGLGDIMPNNATFHPIISALFFFGMPVMKVVNRATYVCIENGVFGAFTLLESSIDRLTSKIQPIKEKEREEEPSLRPSRKISRCSYCTHINEEPEEEVLPFEFCKSQVPQKLAEVSDDLVNTPNLVLNKAIKMIPG